MSLSEKRKIEINLIPERKPNSLWVKVWDMILHPAKGGLPEQLRLEIDINPVTQSPPKDKQKRHTGTKPGKRQKSHQLSLWSLDNPDPER